MSSLLDGILSPALTVATNAVGAHDAATLQSSLRQRSDAIRELLMARQFQQSDDEHGLKLAETQRFQRLNQYAQDPTSDPAYQRRFTIAQTLAKRGAIDPSEVDAYAGDPELLRKALLPNPVDVYAAKRTIAAQNPIPRAPATPRPGTEPPAQTAARRAAAGTMSALTETNGQVRNIDRAMGNAVVPSDTLGMGAERQQLTQRADSLRSAYDQQSQAAQGAPVTSTRPQHHPATASSAPPLAPGDAQRSIQQAANDMQAVLNSTAPDDVKAQARALYTQHVRAISAQARGVPQP